MSKVIIFPTRLFEFGGRVAGASPDSSGCEVEPDPGQDFLPVGCTHSYFHSGSHWDNFRHADSPHIHIFEMWEEARLPGVKPTDMGRTSKLHADHHPLRGIYFFFFLINIITKRPWMKFYLRPYCTSSISPLVSKFNNNGDDVYSAHQFTLW